ncbi:harbinger transposase-derived protein [Artemisia annua]|uniref:Harbinger transposase-derived protein n=1 Tax=Artemisia annua TaxID=35608 RepID=A0A2U1NHD0_ARTAN|nr:harbinger transposase-derived protein [Artemisia annua]
MSSSSSSSSEDELILPADSSELLLSGSILSTYLAVYDPIEDTTSTTETRESVTHFREKALQTLMNDYFVDRPKFPDHVFRDRFRMNKSLFLRIVGDVEANFEWFQEGQDARGKKVSRRNKNAHRPFGNSQRRNGTAPNSSFSVNGRPYKRGYYITDGIYPTYSTFVKAYKYPTDPKEKRFNKLQESARKDVERAFGRLKGKWMILSRPLRAMSVKKIRQLVYTCIIFHNMILKDDHMTISPVHIMDQPVAPVYDESVLPELLDEDIHYRLRYDLTEHVAAQDLPYLDD